MIKIIFIIFVICILIELIISFADAISKRKHEKFLNKGLEELRKDLFKK